MDMNNINMDGCSDSVKRELESMYDTYLESGEQVRTSHKKKKKRNFLQYLFLLTKIKLKNIKPR